MSSFISKSGLMNHPETLTAVGGGDKTTINTSFELVCLAVNFFVFTPLLRESAGVFFLSLPARGCWGIFFSLSLRERVGVRGQAVDVNLPTSSQEGEDRVSFYPHPAFSHFLPSRERMSGGQVWGIPVARPTQAPTFHIQGRSAGALRGQGVVTLMDCRVASAPRNDSKLVVKQSNIHILEVAA